MNITFRHGHVNDLANIKAKTDALQAEFQTSLRILETEFQEAKIVVADAEQLSERVAAINKQSVDCVPQDKLLELQRQLAIAKAAVAEIDAVLKVGRAVARDPS